MSRVFANGIWLSYERRGQGKPVLLIMGSGASGRVWTMYQVPALVEAGYEVVIFDNRGIPPSDAPPGRYSFEDLIADTKGLIEALGLAPCRIVGTSLGAIIAQELAIANPDLVCCAVLIATRARADAFRAAYLNAIRVLAEGDAKLPPAYAAVMSVLQMLSPQMQKNDTEILSWLDLFELSGTDTAPGQAWADPPDDRREALSAITVPCLVVTFSDDVISPPHLGAEVAEAIPDCDLVNIGSCGHLGYLERPAEVNSAIIEFLNKN
jgi:pimeloyl-ACP methyl ester carboxylesterase